MPTPLKILICEGYEDAEFFKKLIELRSLPRFKIYDTSTAGQKRGGINKFAHKLVDLRVNDPAGFAQISDIIIVADNDDDCQNNFSVVSEQIDKIFPGNVPAAPGETTTGKPRITVIMLPASDANGTLEYLCIEPARNIDRNVASQIDNFLAVIGADNWNSEKRYGKAWIRANLAARCVQDPGLTLGKLFSEYHALIDFNHRSLENLCEIISRVGAPRSSSRAQPPRTPAGDPRNSRRSHARARSS